MILSNFFLNYIVSFPSGSVSFMLMASMEFVHLEILIWLLALVIYIWLGESNDMPWSKYSPGLNY